jgi:hypothetical protein
VPGIVAPGMAERDSKRESVDISDTTAPSIGPHTVIERRPPEERLARKRQSDVDAMGLKKRRQVIGGSYSASVTRQVVTYAIVVIVVLAAGFGLKALADQLDKPPAHAEDLAPWTGTEKKAKLPE